MKRGAINTQNIEVHVQYKYTAYNAQHMTGLMGTVGDTVIVVNRFFP